jgi:hypothetical protein
MAYFSENRDVMNLAPNFVRDSTHPSCIVADSFCPVN